MWVVGVIANGCASNEGITETLADSNIVLTEKGQESTVPVQLPSGDIRSALNISDNPDNIGATVKVCGLLQAYFSRSGIKSLTDYDIDETTTGVEETLVDENAPVEYYNLQGVKVEKPEKGIFIKKQGVKTTKVVL